MIQINTLGREIQLFRGKLSELPTLLPGQPACAYDDISGLPSLWVGTETEGNKRVQAEQYIIDDLVSNVADGALSARQGKILKDMIDAIGAGGSSVNVVDNLLSSSPISALSARQGKVLNEKIANHENNANAQKHIELVDVEPADLTNTGVVFLRRDESTSTAPNQPTFDELKKEVDGVKTQVATHLSEDIASESGAHKLRYFNEKLEYNDGLIWNEINTGARTKFYSGDLNNLIENGIYSVPANTPNAPNTLAQLVEVQVSSDGNFMIQKSTVTNSKNDSVLLKRTARKDVNGVFEWATPLADGYLNGWKVENPFLTSSLTSSSTTQAATANAVKMVNDKIEDLKSSVSSGKALVANAITEKGIATAVDAEFATMASNIGLIQTGKGVVTGVATIPTIVAPNQHIFNVEIPFEPKNATISLIGSYYLNGVKTGSSLPINNLGCFDIIVSSLSGNKWNMQFTIGYSNSTGTAPSREVMYIITQ